MVLASVMIQAIFSEELITQHIGTLNAHVQNLLMWASGLSVLSQLCATHAASHSESLLLASGGGELQRREHEAAPLSKRDLLGPSQAPGWSLPQSVASSLPERTRT